MAETEITVQVLDDLSVACDKLEKLGFAKQRQFQLNDWYFSKFNDRQLNSMSYAEMIEHSILVREVISDSVETSLCYKSKVFDEAGNVISEEKISTKISDKESAIKLLTMSGLNMWEEVKDKSVIFSDGKMEFALQLVDGLGLFIELEENDDIKYLDSKTKFAKLKKMVNSLGLTLGTDYSCKKVYMKFKERIKNNRKNRDTISFKKQSKLEKQKGWLMGYSDEEKKSK